MNIPFINSVFTHLENRPVFEVMSKEIMGINAPKTLIVRSSDEMVDVAFNEVGNTAGFFGGGFALQWLIDKLHNKLDTLPEGKALTGSLAERSKLWRQAGKSIAISSVLFSLMWAMPFFRNYITAVRTGTDDYTEVIGSGASGSAHDGSSPWLSSDKEKAFENHKAGYLSTAFTTLGLGFGLGVLALLGSHTAIKRGVPLGKELGELLKTEALSFGDKAKRFLGKAGEWTRKTLGFESGEFKKFGDIHAALFWGLPAYGGWIAASRDGYEKKEQVLKAANFFVWFFGLPALIRSNYVKKYPEKLVKYIKKHDIKRVTKALIEDRIEGMNKLGLSKMDKEKALEVWQSQSVVSLLSSIILLGVSPSILNIWLTKRRLADADKHQATAHFTGRPTLPASSSGRLRRKSFESFVLQRPQGRGYNS